MRGADAHDQRPVQRGRRPPVLQVGNDRLADIGGQRQSFGASSLAGDPKLAGAPVDVIEPERGDLAGAQPQPRSMTSTAKSRRPIAVPRSQHASSASNCSGSSARGSPDSRHDAVDGTAVAQRPGDQAAQMQEPKQ